MARETKVGLLIGVGVILLIAIIVNDHLVTVKTADDPGRLSRFAEATQDELAEQPDPRQPADAEPRRDRYSAADTPHRIESHPGPAAEGARRTSLIPTADELDHDRWQPPRQQGPPRSVQGLHPAVRVDVSGDEANGHRRITTQFASPEASESEQVRMEREPDRAERETRTLSDPDRRTPSEIERRTPPSNAQVIHYVKPGESLWQIADRYLGDGKHWRQIAKANADHVDKNNNVAAGVRLVIPSGAALAEAQRDREDADASSRAIDVTPRGGEVPTLYTVKSGDTLGRIARNTLGDAGRYREIYELNRDRMRDANTVVPGMKLKIPGRGDRASADAGDSPSARSAGGSRIYTVQSGDTLTRIARRLLGDPNRSDDIFEANRDKLDDIDALKVGQALKIPG